MNGDTGPRAIVVMGVSGAGKTTVARTLAARLGGVFIDADDLHSPAARAKMAAGTPLTDEDRTPWLRRVAGAVREGVDRGERVVVACSALRHSYRALLRAEAGVRLFFLHLDGDAHTLAGRLGSRVGHFMSEELLESQLATLERLGPDEDGAVVDVRGSEDDVVERSLLALGPTR